MCEKVLPSAKFYHGKGLVELSRLPEGAEGSMLDLCCGLGALALVRARTTARVIAVESYVGENKPTG